MTSRFPTRAALLVAALALAACQSPGPASSGSAAPTGSSSGLPLATTGVTASDAALVTKSGFLSDYARLAPVAAVEGARCWRKPDTSFRSFDKILVTRIHVTLKPGQVKTVDPSDLKALLDYFHASLVKALSPQWQVVDKPGPGVLVMRIALTDLTPTNVVESLAGTATPYGFVAEIGSGAVTGLPAGATPYLGETGIEVQFRDGANQAILGECEDTEVGRKYAADLNSGASGAASAWIGGYLNSFSAWSYAKDAFDKWAQLTARRLAMLRQQ